MSRKFLPGTAWAFFVLMVVSSARLVAGNGNAFDRIDFGNIASEAAHNFMPGSDPTAVAPSGVGAYGQTYRLPIGTGSSDPTGTQVLTFTMACDPVRQNYITVKLWGSDRNIMMFLLDEKGNNNVPFGDVGLDTFAGHGAAPTFPNRFFYYTLAIPQGMTLGKKLVTLSLFSTESWNRYSSVKLQPMTQGTAGRPVYSALIHTAPCYNPDATEVVGVAPITTGQITNYPTISSTQGLAMIQTCRSNLFKSGGAIDSWIGKQIWTNNYRALTDTNYAPPPPETMGLLLANASVSSWPATDADSWRDRVARAGCAFNSGYTAVPGQMISAYAAAYVMPPFTNAAGAVVAGLDRYHDPNLLLRTVKAIDSSTYLIDADYGFCQQANQTWVAYGDAWTGLCSSNNPRTHGSNIGTTKRLGTIHGGGDLQGSGAYMLGWAICTLLNDTNGATNGKAALMAYLDPTKSTNAFDADLNGTLMQRVYAWERMLFQNVNWYAYATGGTTSQNQFQMIGMYANWVALCRLQELYPNTNYVVKWDASNSTYVTPNYLGTNSPLQAAEMVCGMIPTTLRGSYVSGFTNYAMTAKGLGEGGGSLACGFDGGAYGKFIGQFPLMISQIAAWDTVNVDTNLLAGFARQVNAAHDAFQQLIVPMYYITNPVTSGTVSNAAFTFGAEDFITWRSFENLNCNADGFDVNLNWASAGTNGVVNNAYMRRAAYLQIQYTGGGAPGDPVNADYYEKAVRGLMNVAPSALKALPNEPGQPDYVWFDPQAQSLAFRNNGERIFINMNWRRGPGALTQEARIHHTRANIDTGATIVMPTDAATVQSDGNYSSTNLFDKYVVRYGDYLIAVNSSSNSTQTVKLPAGYGQAKDLVSSNYYNLGSTMTVGPSNAAVLWLAASNAPTGSNAPVVTVAASAGSTNVTGTNVTLSVAGTNSGGGSPVCTWSLAGYPPAPVVFSTNGTASASNVTATFSAAGTYTFNAMLSNSTGSTNSTVTVKVTPTVSGVSVSPTNVVILSDGQASFDAIVTDQFGNVMASGTSVTWSKSSGVGVLTADGSFYPAAGVSGSAVLRASVGSVSATAGVKVLPALGSFAGVSPIGSPSPVGSGSFTPGTNGGVYTIKTGTGDVWSVPDNFQYAWTNVSGDVVITARVKGITNTSNIWAKAGVMIRASSDPNDAYAFCFATPKTNNGVVMQNRDSYAGYMTSYSLAGNVPPAWIRLTRTQDTFVAEYAADSNGVPGTWTNVGSRGISMRDTACVGLAFSGSGDAYSSNALPTAYFDNVTITTPSSQVVAPVVFPTNTAIGASVAGVYAETVSTNALSNTVTLTAQGGDIYGTADGIQYAYQTMIGSGTLTARVASLSVPAAGNPKKAGVMIRESLDAGSREASTLISSASAMRQEYRSSTGGSTTEVISNSYAAPYWVRVVRNGNSFVSYASSNGTSFNQIGSAVTIGMSNTAYIGLAVASLDTANPFTAVFDNISFRGATNTGPAWSNQPSVTLTNLTATLKALAADDGGATNLTYTWYPVGQPPGTVAFSTNNGTSTGTNVTAVLGTSGVYSFKVTAKDAYGVSVSGMVTLGGQTISFPSPGSQGFASNGPLALGATASSGLPVSYWSPSTNVYVSGTNVLMLGVGTATVVAEQWGNSNWPVAPSVTNQAVIVKGSNVIAPFGAIASQSYSGGRTLTVTNPSASSGLPVTLSIKSGPATLSGNTVTITGAGTVTLAANQAGDANYLPSDEVTTSFTVAQGSQTISFPSLAAQTAGSGVTLTLGATSSSGLPVTYASASGNVSISGNVVTILGAGTATITASQAGDANWAAAPQVSQQLVVNQASQTIGAFATIASTPLSTNLLTVTLPTASSGLPVTLSVKSGPASVVGSNALSLSGVGTVILAADQSGNASYGAAAQVTTSFSVTKGLQTITFPAVAPVTYGGGPVTLSATASSGLSVSYGSASTNISISGKTVTLLGAGTATIVASQNGNITTWSAATPVTNTLVINKGSNVIAAFGAIASQVYSNNATLTVTPPAASSGLPVTLAVKSGPATISGNTVTLTGTGTVVLSANQGGNANYVAASEVTVSFAVGSFANVISAFAGIADQGYSSNATVSFTRPTANSGLPVTVSVKGGPALLVGSNTLSLTGVGTVTLAANQAGDSNYPVATEVTTSFVVAKGSQSINFPSPGSRSYGDAPFVLGATASSGLAVSYSSTGNISVVANGVTILGAGTATITATQAGNDLWSAATPVTNTFVIAQASNVIASFAPIASQIYSSNASVGITAPSASSGLPVTLSVKSGPATLSGNTLSLTGTGTVTLAANQAGDANYVAAGEVTTSFAVSTGTQTITFAPLAPATFGDGPITLGASASSGLSVAYASSSTNIAIASNGVTILGAGTASIVASQSGNPYWSAATPVTNTLVINKASNVIAAFEPVPDTAFAEGLSMEITPPAASSGLPVTLSVKSGPATLSGNTLSVTGVGTVVLAANQAGNGNYLAAAEVTESFAVNAGSQAITFAPLAPATFGDGPITLGASASSGLPVSYTSTATNIAIASNGVTILGAGTASIVASQPGNNSWSAATPVTNTLVIAQASNVIAPFASVSDITYSSGASLSVTTPSASSGLPVTLAVKSGPATLLGNTVSLSGTGTVTLSANQSGNANYLPADEVTVSFASLAPTNPNIITPFAPIAPVSYLPKYVLTIVPPPAASGMSVKVTVKNGPGTISGNKLTLTGAGTITLAANQSGGADKAKRVWPAADEVTTSIVVNPGANYIAPFAVIPSQTYLGKALKLTAPKATSALPVTLSIKSGPATLSGGVTLTTTGAGTVTVAANQGGNANYLPATEVTTSFTVNKAAQKITLAKIAAQTNGMAPFTPVGSSSSGLQITYSILSGPALVVSSNKVALLGVGTVTLAANQSGNSNFLAAPQVSAAFAVVAPKAGKLPTNAVGNVADANTIPTIPLLPTLPLSVPTNAGSVVAWGDNTFGETNLPAGLTNVVQISSRGVHTLALLANGTVKAWGLNQSGQAGVPSSLTNVVQVAAGTHHSLALINNGTVIGWGDDSFGQVGGALQITNAVQIAAGNDHSIALLADGTVAGWGWDAYGQASGGAGISNAVQVAAGYFHSAALLNDGTVQAWGDNTYSESTVPSGATNVVQLAAGLNHTVALKGDGSVLAWGWNNAGQTNVPVLSGGVCQIATGGNTVFAVTTNGTLITWGDNTYGQQKPPSTLSKVIQFVLGLYHAAALKK